MYKKNDFAEISKNVSRYIFEDNILLDYENNYVGNS